MATAPNLQPFSELLGRAEQVGAGAVRRAMPTPKASQGNYATQAASRGRALFNGKAKCSTCDVPPLFTEPGYNVEHYNGFLKLGLSST